MKNYWIGLMKDQMLHRKKKKSDFEDIATGNETIDIRNKINRAIKNNGTTT